MRRLFVLVAAFAVVFSWAGTASAGSPHFIKSATGITAVFGSSLTVSFKEAGLGDEAQVHVVLTADVQCVNPGGNDPAAGNKQTVSVAGDFPVQRGSASGELTLTPVLQPSCSPPMTLRFSNVSLVDETSGATADLS